MKPKTILMTCMILIILTGCINLNPKKTTTASSLFKGTKGLEMSFVKNAPPSKVFASANKESRSKFKAIVNVKNKGAYDVGFDEQGTESDTNKGILVLTPESGYVDIIDLDEQPNIESAGFSVRGRSLSNDVGDEINVYSTLEARELSSLSALHSSTIFATICYPYQTKVSTSVCIDPDIYDLGTVKQACDGKDLSLSGGQGAPVAVTNVEVRMSPEGKSVNPQFLIHVENKGDGEIVRKEKYVEACQRKISSEKDYFNVVNIKAELSGKELKCDQVNDEKIVVLDGKKGIIKCSLDILNEETENKNAYVAPLSIVLDYGYTRTISKGFNIEKPG